MHYTRRQFIWLNAGAIAAAGLPSILRDSSDAGRHSLGFSLYGMKQVPLPEALAQCARIGYRNVELALLAGYPTEPQKLSAAERKDLRYQVGSLGLSISSLNVNMALGVNEQAHSLNLDTIKVAAEFAHFLSPTNPPIIQTVLGGKSDEWNALKEQMAGQLRAWASTAASSNIVIAVKAHVSMAVNSPERLLWLLHQVERPEIRIAYDYSHFELQGIPLKESLAALAPYTVFVHVKDSQGSGKTGRFLLPGEGRIDYVTYFRLLEQFGYRGPVVVEVSSQIFTKPGYDPIKAAEKSYRVLNAALQVM